MIFPAVQHKNQSGSVRSRAPSSPVILAGSRGSHGPWMGPRLLWLPQGGPLAAPHIFCRRTSALLASLSGIWGSAHSTRRLKGVFLEVLLAGTPSRISSAVPAPGRSLSRTRGQHRVPWEQPAPPGSGGEHKAHISNDFLTNSAAHCLFSFINCSTPAI